MNNESISKPTVHGVIKGRPGKGRVLSLGQRRKCYAGHPMDGANVDRFQWCLKCRESGKSRAYSMAREKCDAGHPLKGENATVREWCRKCRADSRKRWYAARNSARQAAEQARADKVSAELDAAFSDKKPKPKPAKAAKPKPAKAPKSEPKREVTKTGAIQCGECSETFPDPLTASKHFRKKHGRVKKAA